MQQIRVLTLWSPGSRERQQRAQQGVSELSPRLACAFAVPLELTLTTVGRRSQTLDGARLYCSVGGSQHAFSHPRPPRLVYFLPCTTMEGVERLAPDARLLPRPLDSHRPLRIPTPTFPPLPLLRYLPPADRGFRPISVPRGKHRLFGGCWTRASERTTCRLSASTSQSCPTGHTRYQKASTPSSLFCCACLDFTAWQSFRVYLHILR